jgi:hypothetical protein
VKTIFIIGSPKKKISTSAALLGTLPDRIRDSEPIFLTTSELTPENTAEEAAKAASLIKDADAVVIGFPLYVDGIPSHLLRLLEAIGRELVEDVTEIIDLVDSGAENRQPVYAVINCGFYEPGHMDIAAGMTELWCESAGLDYKGAVLVGAGGMGPMIAKKSGPGKNIGKALDKLAAAIADGKPIGTVKVTPVFPRKLYIWGGNRSWIKEAKKRGVSKDKVRGL